MSAIVKKFRIFLWWWLSVAAAGCADESGGGPVALEDPVMSPVEQQRVHAAWRVDMITANNSDMLTEYSYDEGGRLLKKRVADIIVEPYRTITRTREERYDWKNDRLSGKTTLTRYQDDYFGYDDDSTYETLFEYDPRGRLHYDDGFVYDDEGHLVQTYSYEFAGQTYEDELVWENGNVVMHISSTPEGDILGSPVPGTRTTHVAEYRYDNNPKPNFGLGDLFSWAGNLDPWPYVENTDLARSLSRNNLTRTRSAGYEYRYTYNEHGLPETVQTILIGIETDEEVVQTIHYKKVVSD